MQGPCHNILHFEKLFIQKYCVRLGKNDHNFNLRSLTNDNFLRCVFQLQIILPPFKMKVQFYGLYLQLYRIKTNSRFQLPNKYMGPSTNLYHQFTKLNFCCLAFNQMLTLHRGQRMLIINHAAMCVKHCVLGTLLNMQLKANEQFL